MIEISTRPNEESTIYITVTFYDKDGIATAPTTATWTLTDKKGNIINDREDVEIETPESSEEITLSGDDLVIGDYGFSRIITVSATLDGNPIHEEGIFSINELVNI